MNTKEINYKEFYENIVLQNIDLESYDIIASNDFDKVNHIYNIFLSEKGYAIERIGEFNAFTEWLQGLPTVLTVPFYYFEQIKLARDYGMLTYSDGTPLPDDHNGVEIYCKGFFARCTSAFFTLKENL